MTVSDLRITHSGSGRIRGARLSIEGLEEFVSHISMVNAAAARPRYHGLSLPGLKLAERCDIAKATLDVASFTAEIADIKERPTLVLAKRPQNRTWLAADIDPSDTTIDVASTSGFPSSGTIWLDREAITYLALNAGTQFTGCTRGAWGTMAASHYTADGALRRYPEVTDRPVQLRGRRAELYLYSDGDSLSGDGTLVYRGIVATDAKYDGTKWALTIDPITRILKQQLGSDLGDPVTPRGIYFSIANPWHLTISYNDVDDTLARSVWLDSGPLTGHYETQEEFCAAAQVLIDTMLSGASITTVLQILPSGPNGYFFRMVTDGTPRAVCVEAVEPITEPVFIDVPQVQDGDNYTMTTVPIAANTEYFFVQREADRVPGAGTVPRGIWNGRAFLPIVDTSSAETPQRIYLAGALPISSLTSAALVDWAEGPMSGQVTTVDSSSRSIEVIPPAGGLGYAGTAERIYTASSLPHIRLGRQYVFTSLNGSIYDLMAALATNVETELNLGTQPDIRFADFSNSAWSVLSDDEQPSVVRSRRYTSFSPLALEELVCPEVVQAGYFIALDASSKLTVRKLQLPSAVDVSATITRSKHVNDDGALLQYEKQGLGIANTIVYRVGYDPIEDEYRLPPITVRDVMSFGQAPEARPITIEPKSEFVGNPLDETTDLVRLASSLVGVLGAPYEIVTIGVPLTEWAVLCGSSVALELAHMPATDGTRGTTSSARYGLLIGREWEPFEARGTWTLLVPADPALGYAPSFKADAISNVGSDLFEFTAATGYLPSGMGLDELFDVGDRVQVYRWNSTSGGVVAGEVTAVASGTVTAELSGFAEGGDEWVFAFDEASAGSATTNMRRFAFVAASTGIIDWSPDPDTQAAKFSP